MSLPRRVTRSVLLSGILFAAALVFYVLPLHQRRPSPIDLIVEDLDLPPPSFDWSTVGFFHHIPDLDKALPREPPRALPRIQADAASFPPAPESEARRRAVRDAFQRSYGAYRKHAWMRDELVPVAGGGRDTFGGWAATLVDCLDTLWIMGLRAEFAEAVAAVGAIDWSRTGIRAANMFETTIRYLGGLLSAYDLSGDRVLLRKAVELGEMLFRGFDTPNGMPPFWLDFAKARSGRLVAGSNDASASPCSLGLEFTRLSQVTGDPKYYAATDRVTRFLESIQNDTSLPGLWPRMLNFRDLRAVEQAYTLGAGADSLYEYLPKMHALLGGVDGVYEKLFRGSMDAAVRSLLFRPMLPDDAHADADDADEEEEEKEGKRQEKKEEKAQDVDILFSGEFAGGARQSSSQHLTCFAGGMFGLGGRLFSDAAYVSLGARLARGCAWAYRQFPTGIMPELFSMLSCETLDADAACAWDEDRWRRAADPGLPRGFTHARDRTYLLRPEAIESVFVMHRITGDAEWLARAWDMFGSIMNATTTDLANSAIRDVTVEGPTEKTDSMEVGTTKQHSTP
ncbi:putative mannosyl-oligosaccharide alpha-1 [Escovopsis weberi]|uniref:alpha-1,2-Mannosidase n=1 Tax=Escovopsis weberi TaxID=150374 RepID=A0A0M8N9X4_ESCWE|nr:putative mannosyl-oligosaccharide alpha-1 [Escovopsis weberi]